MKSFRNSISIPQGGNECEERNAFSFFLNAFSIFHFIKLFGEKKKKQLLSPTFYVSEMKDVFRKLQLSR